MNKKNLFHSPGEKRQRNSTIFSCIGSKYNSATRLLSFGQDRRWKKFFVDSLPDIAPKVVLDIASGSGDILTLLRKKYPAAQVLGSDLTFAMVDVPENRENTCTLQDMQNLALPDASVDILTGGYALRNAPDLSAVMDEIFRVLRPGGVAAFLDFSTPKNHLHAKINRALLYIWGYLWSLILHGRGDIYTYIPESLKTYPTARDLRKKFYKRGFEKFLHRKFFFGFTEMIIVEKRANETAE
ncbi:class I SAM-dependent methyltransferase [Chitinivibrio alkaliphilus]|uniref:Ubiquinone/menaquinone biosynthesis methyltransferase UbiE n=1 Tax=Chitinivibrio alkaliphilus ACht1 TaxID=1313304 RepID=U7DB58_9BACT|nr:class I SAM-dependent methyltransferase [Chitinivibrio alkaliphilus]ERP38778.1 ubiquinone/menaquinone biosynthesis methyltransferase UbiE [Chitinivibrio alkaliphilus ACht1]